ncbi:MAG: N-acetyl-gamma-glutamyl-phosphate reductase [Gammaproteobacteria bacterium]
MTRLALIGARGHTGGELIRLIDAHPALTLSHASSRQHAGEPVAKHVSGIRSELSFCELTPQQLEPLDVDALILALPNQLAAPWVEAFRRGGHDGPVIDLSADYRFDDAWHYGLPELTRDNARGKMNISNPGCYATAMQLALHPFRDLMDATPTCFGISGYSGAGTTASDKNDPDKLRHNVMPYAPFDHIHEREVSRQLGRPVRFLPHVAEFFRGIAMTVTLQINVSLTTTELNARLNDCYDQEALVRVTSTPPWVAHNAGQHHACVGGLAQRDHLLTVYATLDNLLKGAATQAVQNLNLALGRNEYEGIPIG